MVRSSGTLAWKLLDVEVPEPERAAPRAVSDLLADVAGLDRGATGALAFGVRDRLLGMVLLERGRVCWATVAGMGERLRALVTEVASAPSARARVDEIFRACLRDNRPLGEALIASRIVTESSLRAVLKRQMAEALLAMAEDGAAPLGWIPRHARSYSPSFSFSAADMIVAAAAVTSPRACAAAAEELSEVIGPSGAGVSYAREERGAAPTPVCLTGPVDLDLAEVLALGRWAMGGVERAAAIAPRAPYVCAMLDRTAAVVAWSTPLLAHVALCTEQSRVALVISKLERERARR